MQRPAGLGRIAPDPVTPFETDDGAAVIEVFDRLGVVQGIANPDRLTIGPAKRADFHIVEADQRPVRRQSEAAAKPMAAVAYGEETLAVRAECQAGKPTEVGVVAGEASYREIDVGLSIGREDIDDETPAPSSRWQAMGPG